MAGNPEFGTKYRFPTKEEIRFDAQVRADIHTSTKNKIVEIAKKKKCSVPDILREAIYKYLEENTEITA